MPKRFRITVSRVRFHWIKSSLTMTTVSLHLFPPLMLQQHARYYIVSMISKSGILPCTEIFFYRNNNQTSREDYIFNFLRTIFIVYSRSSNLEYFFFSCFFYIKIQWSEMKTFPNTRKNKDNSTIVIVDYRKEKKSSMTINNRKCSTREMKILCERQQVETNWILSLKICHAIVRDDRCIISRH